MQQDELKRYIPLAVWIVVILTLLCIPSKIISYGYLPADDALRHAAKAVSGKPWQEILVMRPDFRIDPHPGWHAVLGAIHHATNCGTESLVLISIIGLMLLLSAVVLPRLRWPETWLASLLVVAIFVPRFINRLLLGRPYLFTIAVFLALIFIWFGLQNRRPRWAGIIASIILIALAAWIHGSWYQLGLPIAALVLAAQWRSAAWYGASWLAGSVLGCGFTGHPVGFLEQSVHHLFGVFGDYHLDRQLVAELLPSGGDPQMVLFLIGILLWRFLPGTKFSSQSDATESISATPSLVAGLRQSLYSPLFLMAMVGWLLGLRVFRFWDDWGLPALMVWLAFELQSQLQNRIAFDSPRRLLVTLGLAMGLFLSTTSDLSNRWTSNLTNEFLVQGTPELTGWFPDDHGIFYSADMRFFNETFFKNPTAPWRYVLGFESALMQPEDLDVVRKVQWNYGDVQAYEPWLKKMKPEDRLALRASWLPNGGPPNLPELEWRYAVKDIWIGRLTNNPAPAKK